MLNDLSKMFYERTAKHKITHVSISHDKTRMFVHMDVDIIGFGKQNTVSHIWIIGNNKNILDNTWILVRVIVLNKKQMKDERKILSEATKKEIWDFVLANKDKIEKAKWRI